MFQPNLCSLIGSAQEFRAESRLFDPGLADFFPRMDDSDCDRIYSSLSAVRCFDDCYKKKLPVVWKEYFGKNIVESTGN